MGAGYCQSIATGYNMLVVFKGKGTIAFTGSASGRPFQGTILAPWAHVIAEGSTSYLDGAVIAKSFESSLGNDQMHAYLYNGPMTCTPATPAGSGSGPACA